MGKSWQSLRLSEKCDNTFLDNPFEAVHNQIFYKANEFMRGIRTLKNNQVLLYDEPGQTWNNREFMQEINIVLSKTVLGFGFKGFKTFFCVPTLLMIDKSARCLSNFMINLFERGRSEVFKVTVGKFTGEPYYSQIISNMKSETPGVKLRHYYETRKKEIQEATYGEYEKILDRKEDDKVKPSNPEMIAEIRADPESYSKKGRLYSPKVMYKLGVGRNRADMLIAGVEDSDPTD